MRGARAAQKAELDHKVMRRVYVFSLPIRFFHWINALAIIVLIVTGLIMANPPAIQQGQEASFGYWFGTVRFIHFASAYIFTVGFAFRMYWMFAGNKYERWENFISMNKAFWKDLVKVIQMDVLLKKNKQHFAIDHNALAGFSYFMLFVLMLLMVLTGFALYSSMSPSWFPQLLDWVTGVLGGDIITRQVHHVAMWAFVIFIIIHVYLVFYHDYVEGHGEISSMGGGWKFIEEDCLEKEDCNHE